MSEDTREAIIQRFEAALVQMRECSRYTPEDVDELESAAWDVFPLLKAQEPILLENPHKPYGHFTSANSPWISRCPKCRRKVEGRQTRFCKYCGQAVKWDG